MSRDVISFLRGIGGAVWSTEQGFRRERGGTRQTPGLPDLVVIFPTAWTFAELKAGKGKLSQSQEGFRDTAVAAGVPWQLWRSSQDAFDWCVSVGILELA